MNVDKKLEYFASIINSEAQAQKDSILAEYDEELRCSMAEIRKEAEKQANKRIQSEIHRIDGQKNKDIVNASGNAKKEALELRARLVDTLFEEVQGEIDSFIVSAKYCEYLSSGIAKCLARYPEGRIQIMERDREHVTGIPPESIETVDEDFLGGFRLLLPQRNAMEDHSLISRVRRERKNFNELSAFNDGR